MPASMYWQAFSTTSGISSDEVGFVERAMPHAIAAVRKLVERQQMSIAI